mmetsp:Transcript_42111/g.77954  ORF Transcript_42111/g.77954 Transcript_42111/m.77954 type:complete len:181 (-) Transcript_42111:242-784(-)|eukprot:CAMPEP_0197447526 /NCGR_PEP_ID=MMETSP1175-20131217/13636_1 /TAXON_ID=1003142 /ORGANISM="Triceratium dubium, Strain CCMP147" /LENGTH=180 /DNA_ID=CAMNT_0042978865 /DNA_START=50 /DNA_END=592 /DNA_ORIENTATION=-
MKSVAVFACLVATASAFSPLMATRAVGKAAAESSAPPESKGYPSIADSAESFKPFANISGGGNKGPPQWWTVPDFSDPALQIERDPAFYAEAAKTRLSKGKTEFAYDDGLTELERRQRGTAMSTFLTGSAKSQVDTTSIRDDIAGEDFLFGLSADRFQLLFIAVFGLFTLVGCLSGTVQL